MHPAMKLTGFMFKLGWETAGFPQPPMQAGGSVDKPHGWELITPGPHQAFTQAEGLMDSPVASQARELPASAAPT